MLLILGEVLCVHTYKQASCNPLMQKNLTLGNKTYWKQTPTSTFPVTLGLKHTILRTRTNCNRCLWWCCFLVFSFLSLSICCPLCLDCLLFEQFYSVFAQWLAWCGLQLWLLRVCDNSCDLWVWYWCLFFFVCVEKGRRPSVLLYLR